MSKSQNVDAVSSKVATENGVGQSKVREVIAILERLHPEMQWSLYPLDDYEQYAEIDAPDVLVSFGNEEQELEGGLVDPYSTMMGEACEPALWGLSEEAAQIMQAHNRVFVAKYPNCDGPRQYVVAG